MNRLPGTSFSVWWRSRIKTISSREP